MNTHAEYRRHIHRPPKTSYSPASSHDVNQLAHHADPSLTQAPPTGTSSKRVAWIRPTELASFTGPLVGRGIDLQAELIRRARRTPKTTTRAVRRRIDQSLHPERTAPREEGIGQ